MKIVYGNTYFTLDALPEIPENLRNTFESARTLAPCKFSFNLVKIDKHLCNVTLSYYPDLEFNPHPYLKHSIKINTKEKTVSSIRIESASNPVILHRLETMLHSKNHRIEILQCLTIAEEKAGMFEKAYSSKIGRLLFWNDLCYKNNQLNSLAELETNKFEPLTSQIPLFAEDTMNIIRREHTAISRTKPSSPTMWAHSNNYIKSTVYDWGCGKGMDSEWLISLGYRVISYDPYHNPQKTPDSINFSEISTILLNYVLNVIESQEERSALLRSITYYAKKGTTVVISVRSEKDIENSKKSDWIAHDDGYITTRRTFQKGYSMEEVVAISSNFSSCVCIKNITNSIILVATV